ncbi:hypothetical protein LINPERHAP2_LOCUS13424, partial [Linum perenne]
LFTANDLGSAGSSSSSSSATKAVLKVKLEREEEYRETPWTNKITRRWTDTEVSNLVEGVSQFGTKRWPDIKKMQLWSDSPRKPGDLRVLTLETHLKFGVTGQVCFALNC